MTSAFSQRGIFSIPFEFHGDAVVEGFLDGKACGRCVWDTGAAASTLRIPERGVFSSLDVDATGFAQVASWRVGAIDFGPLRIRVRVVPGLSAPEFYVGMDVLGNYCLTMDYRRREVRFSRVPLAEDAAQAAMPIGFVRGRPVIHPCLGEIQGAFVLDTGSNGNWIFHSAQTPEILALGEIKERKVEAQCGLGNVSVRRSLILPHLRIGGALVDGAEFLLAEPGAFGGDTLETGIIGTGAVAELYAGPQVLDFISKRYLLC